MSEIDDLRKPDVVPSTEVDPPTSQPNASANSVNSVNSRASTVSTRTGVAWLGLCVGAGAFVVLIVFMLQNTRSTEVNFLWMHPTVPLALALLIAAVGSALLTMAVGVARITQLRRLARRQPR